MAGGPIEKATGFGAIEILLQNLVRRLVEDGWLERFLPHQPEDCLHEIENRDRSLGPEIERLPQNSFIGHLLGQQEVRLDGVLYIEVVADELTITADDRALVENGRADRPGN